MCSNYRPAARQLLQKYQLELPDFDYGEAYPGLTAPVLTNFDRSIWLPAAFGLVPAWAKDATIARRTYNARSETVAEKPSFRHSWKQRQLCIIPAEVIYEPNYQSGKAVRWRIERADGEPFGIAGIWERRLRDDGLPRWSMSMLTINADAHPFMRRFHKPGDEKRSIVIIPDDEWRDWLSATSEAQVRSFLHPFDPDLMTATADPRPARRAKTEADGNPPSEEI